MALFLEKLYPDLFEGLTLEQVERLNNSWAAQWHEGWEPNRAQVELSVRRERGEVSRDGYIEAVVTGALHQRVREANRIVRND